MVGRVPEPSYFEYTAADAGSLASLSREPSVPGTRLGLPLDRVSVQALNMQRRRCSLVRGAMAPFDFSWLIRRREPCAQVSSQTRGRFLLDFLLHALSVIDGQLL